MVSVVEIPVMHFGCSEVSTPILVPIPEFKISAFIQFRTPISRLLILLIYEQTVIGARKQYKAGRALITGGIIGIGAGVAGAVLTGVKVAKAGYSDVEAAVQKDASIAAMYLGSTAIMSLGATALSGGIVFKTIGKKRLDWVAGQANGVNLTCQFGPTSDGMGLSLRF